MVRIQIFMASQGLYDWHAKLFWNESDADNWYNTRNWCQKQGPGQSKYPSRRAHERTNFLHFALNLDFLELKIAFFLNAFFWPQTSINTRLPSKLTPSENRKFSSTRPLVQNFWATAFFRLAAFWRFIFHFL